MSWSSEASMPISGMITAPSSSLVLRHPALPWSGKSPQATSEGSAVHAYHAFRCCTYAINIHSNNV